MPPSCNSSFTQSYLPAPSHLTSSDYAPHAILMMAVISLPTNTVKAKTSIRRKSRARLWSMESPENHPKGSLVVSFLFLLEPKGDPAQRSAFGKEEGGCEYGAFAAPAEAEWSRLLLTLRRFFSFSEKRKKRMGAQKYFQKSVNCILG